MTDLHRILARLQPEPDGEPTLSRRTATLTAINGDGTVQINLSGVDVQARALSGWNMQIGTTVQVLVERGDLLVLGEAITPGGGFVTNITQDVIEFGSADTLVCAPHGIPFQPDPAHFQLTARNNPGSALHWWVHSVDATDLCIALDQASGGDLGIAWRHIGGPLAYGCADNADIIYDGWAYHVFTTDGTFTPSIPGTFDILIIGGGGGGGKADPRFTDIDSSNKNAGGGGGAGEVFAVSGWAIGAAVPVVVGVGGTGGSAGGVTGPPGPSATDGTASSVDGILVAAGGGAGGDYFTAGQSGGSGGGSSNDQGAGSSTATGGVGHAGGSAGAGSAGRGGGGGGGAGAPGTDNPTNITDPAGGDGVYLAAYDAPGLGSPQGWFGGGGGGGTYGGASLSTGGAGGGGAGGISSPGSQPAGNGVDGTGGGGGGARSQGFGIGYDGGNGGDGIVIIRHPVCVPLP